MSAVAGIIMLARFNSVRVGHGESYLLITVLACFLGGVNPFGGFGRVIPVFVALVVLQLLSSGLNLMGANQHLATAVWGILLIAVMILRWLAAQLMIFNRRKG
jgi:simple sugar transport system permease protein